MKKIIYILFFVFTVIPQVYAGINQNKSDSSKTNETYIDDNQNGINDKDEKGKGKCYRGKRRDKFVDKDNDGICDDREKGIGPKRRHRNGKNKN